MSKYTCQQIGVCQGRTPACFACPEDDTPSSARLIATPVRVPFCDPCNNPDADIDPDRPDGDGNWDAIAHYAAIAIAGLMTVALFGVTAGYVYANWGL